MAGDNLGPLAGYLVRPTLMKGPMQTYHCATFTNFLGQDSSDASQLPRTHMLVVSESIL